MKIAIVGSRGFIGQHLTRHLLTQTSHSLVLVSRKSSPSPAGDERAVTRVGSLLEPISLATALADAEVVVNLASPVDAAPTVWARNLVAALRNSPARRVVHCSTAVVVGRTPDVFIHEATPARPVTTYERKKLEAERELLTHLPPQVALVIARPTVVFGAGGQNLVSLATSLVRRQVVRDLLRRVLFGDRHMHLVPVGTVARALGFMVDRELRPGSVLQIAADEDPENRYRAVERRLRIGLGLSPAPEAGLVLPPAILHTALRLRGRSDTDPRRRYSSSALQTLGFSGGEPVGDAVETFARWLVSRAGAPS